MTYAGIVINGLVGAVAIVITIRSLGPSGYGWFAIYGVVSSCVGLLDFAIGKRLVARLASEAAIEQQILCVQKALASYLLVAAALIVLTPLAAYVTPRAIFPVPAARAAVVQWIVVVAAVEYALAIPVNLLQASTMAQERFDCYGRWVVVSGLYRNGLMVTAAVLSHSALITVAALAARRLVDIVVAPGLLVALPRGGWRPHLDVRGLFAELKASADLAAVQCVQVAMIGAGAVLVNRHLGLAALGLYRAQFDLASKVWVVSTGVGLVAFPRFNRLLIDAAHRARLRSRLDCILNASWASYNLIVVTAALLVPIAVNAMAWPDSTGQTLFLLLVLGVAVNAHANLASEFLQAAGRARFVAAAHGMALTVLVGIFVTTSRQLGVAGIGWAWAISQLLFSVVLDFEALRAVQLPLFSTVRTLAFNGLVVTASAVALLADVGRLQPRLAPIAIFLVMGFAAVSVRRARASRSPASGRPEFVALR